MVSWKEFIKALCCRFGNMGFEDVIGEFNKIKQLGTIEEYQERFEDLKLLMLAENPNFTRAYFLLSFVGELQEELKSMVRVLKPAILLEAFKLARLHKIFVNTVAKKSRMVLQTL